MLKVQRPRGTNDFFYDECKRLDFIEKTIKSIASNYGYGEIRTPLFEYTELFTRGIGEETDIVGKEMFTFEDRGGRSLTLRPEGTAAVVRAFIEHSLQNENSINKFFYVGPMYRAERPQKGRYREFNQFGIEFIGSDSPLADVEIILLNLQVLKAFGINETKLILNTVGCKNCKPVYDKALIDCIKDKKEEVCDTCKVRYEKNILRMLDCKNEKCQTILKGIPKFYDYVCSECREHFDTVCRQLKKLNISFEVNPMLVRGFDYYTKTAFEIQSTALGSQSAILGGGRYDGLVGMFNNGKNVPAVGSAMGLERLLIMLEDKKLIDNRLYAFVIAFKETEEYILSILERIRALGLSADADFSLKSIKTQFKTANKKNAKYAVIIGLDEVQRGKCKVRNMDTGEESEVSIDNIENYIKNS